MVGVLATAAAEGTLLAAGVDAAGTAPRTGVLLGVEPRAPPEARPRSKLEMVPNKPAGDCAQAGAAGVAPPAPRCGVLARLGCRGSIGAKTKY